MFLFLTCLSSAVQVAGDRCGSGQSLPGQRKLPWAVLLYREASEVLSDWSYSGGEMSTNSWVIQTQYISLNTVCIYDEALFHIHIEWHSVERIPPPRPNSPLMRPHLNSLVWDLYWIFTKRPTLLNISPLKKTVFFPSRSIIIFIPPERKKIK